MSRPATLRLFEGLLVLAIAMLLLSTFRAPASMPSLEGPIRWSKALTRLVVLGSVVSGLLLCRGQLRPRATIRYFLPLFVFGGFGVLSTAWSPLRAETLGQAGGFVTLVLVSLSVALLCRQPADLERMGSVLLLLLTGLCLILLVAGVALPATAYLTREGFGLGHSTNSSATASLSLTLLTLACFVWRWPWAIRASLPLGLVFAAVLFISGNRLSLAITAFLLPTIVLIFGGRKAVGLVLVGVSVIAVLYPILDSRFVLADAVLEKLSLGQSKEELSSLSGRELMWQMIWESFLESPWLGHGYFVTSARGELEVWYSEGEIVPANWTAHNFWLQALATTGVVGLSLLMVGLLYPLAHILRSAVRTAPERESAAGPESGWRFSPLGWSTVILLAWYALWGILNESFLGPIQPESVVFFVGLGAAIGMSGRRVPADG